MAALTILADENIPFAREAFGSLGDVRLANGRRITRDALGDVDILVVRSITTVDSTLLAGTGVRFVGTATSGSDHFVTDDLARLGISHYAALGCNANAVAEFMVAAWLVLARRRECTLAGRRVGIIGVGHVGSLVADKASALGMVPVLNDPPKFRETGDHKYRPIDELSDCDIISCHTPLTHDGADATYRLISEPFFLRLKPGAWFCNAGRGEVVDEAALGRALDRRRLGAAVLDVWDREPHIDRQLVARVDIGTPHIAGYSLEGKLNATAMVYEAACRFLGVGPTWHGAAEAPPPAVPQITTSAAGRSDVDVLHDIVATIYPITRDHEALRRVATMSAHDAGAAFDDLRRAYPTRREFRQTAVTLRGGTPRLAGILAALQFQLFQKSIPD